MTHNYKLLIFVLFLVFRLNLISQEESVDTPAPEAAEPVNVEVPQSNEANMGGEMGGGLLESGDEVSGSNSNDDFDYNQGSSGNSNSRNYSGSSQNNSGVISTLKPQIAPVAPDPQYEKISRMEEQLEIITLNKCNELAVDQKEFTVFLGKVAEEMYVKNKAGRLKLKGVSQVIIEKTAIEMKSLVYLAEQYEKLMQQYEWMNFLANYIDSLSQKVVCDYVRATTSKFVTFDNEKFYSNLIEMEAQISKKAKIIYKGAEDRIQQLLAKNRDQKEKKWIDELNQKAKKASSQVK